MSPTRMAVWDRGVGKSLKTIGRKPKGRRDHYKNYLEIVVDLAWLCRFRLRSIIGLVRHHLAVK